MFSSARLVAMLLVQHFFMQTESLSAPVSLTARVQSRFPSFVSRTRRCISSTRRGRISTPQEPTFPKERPYMAASADTASSPQDPSSTTSSDNPVSQGDGSSMTPLSAVPSYWRIIVFVGTTVLIWLSEPLLSLVDTTVVGRSSSGGGGTSNLIELAALGPATLLIDSGIYVTYFLAVATTTVMAKSLAQRNPRALRRHASHVLGVASILGALVTAFVFGIGRQLLTSWISGASSEGLVQAALSYAKIRSTVAPLVIMGLVAQAICLASLDTKTPALAVAVASVVNIVGDIWLVTKCGMGIRGAAIATAAASVSSTVVLLLQVKKKMNQWRKDEEEQGIPLAGMLPDGLQDDDGNESNGVNGSASSETQQETQSSSTIARNEPEKNGRPESEKRSLSRERNNTERREGEVNARGERNVDPPTDAEPQNVLVRKSEDIPFMSLPNRRSFIKLVKLSGPIFFVMVGKVVCYNAMTLRAADFGVLALASHNVMMRVVFFYMPFGDSLSQAAQSFLPQVLYKTKGDKSQPNKSDIRKLLLRLGILSTYLGVVNSQMAGWILRNCGSSFTEDPAIIKLMRQHTRYLGLSVLVHPFIMLFEGSLIAARDLVYLVWNYALTMGLLELQLRFACSDFAGVWLALFVFQSIRLVEFSTRFFNKIILRKGSNEDQRIN